MLITPAEILDLIGEIGQQMTLETPNPATPAQINFDIGKTQTSAPITRQVTGYLSPPAGYKELATSGGSNQSGELIAYLSAHDLSQADIKPGSRLVVNNICYSCQYIHGMRHRGTLMIHQIKLVPDKAKN